MHVVRLDICVIDKGLPPDWKRQNDGVAPTWPPACSEHAEEFHQVLFFPSREPRAKDEIEELDRVFQAEKATVVQVRRRVLDAANRELDLGILAEPGRPCAGCHEVAYLVQWDRRVRRLAFYCGPSRLYNDCQY
jgi:hypothetical protein